MTLRRRTDHLEMPWKNGAGTTLEVLRLPEGSSMDDFDVRLSFARVDQGGPFSAFPGIDRVILLVRGGRLVLEVGDPAAAQDAGEQPDALAVHDLGLFEPFAFPGEAAVTSTITEPSLDFNVMTRRATASAEVEVHHLDGIPLLLDPTADQRWVVVLDGSADVTAPDLEPATLRSLDVLGPVPSGGELAPYESGAVVAVVTVRA